MITAAQLAQISNCASIVAALDWYGAKVGLDRPHRLCHDISRLAVESGGFEYGHDFWEHTAVQERYDIQTNLGITAATDGDGYLYRGRGPIQITFPLSWDRALSRRCARPDEGQSHFLEVLRIQMASFGLGDQSLNNSQPLFSAQSQ